MASAFDMDSSGVEIEQCLAWILEQAEKLRLDRGPAGWEINVLTPLKNLRREGAGSLAHARCRPVKSLVRGLLPLRRHTRRAAQLLRDARRVPALDHETRVDLVAGLVKTEQAAVRFAQLLLGASGPLNPVVKDLREAVHSLKQAEPRLRARLMLAQAVDSSGGGGSDVVPNGKASTSGGRVDSQDPGVPCRIRTKGSHGHTNDELVGRLRGDRVYVPASFLGERARQGCHDSIRSRADPANAVPFIRHGRKCYFDHLEARGRWPEDVRDIEVEELDGGDLPLARPQED